MNDRPSPTHEVGVEVADLEIIDPGGLLETLDLLQQKARATGSNENLSDPEVLGLGPTLASDVERVLVGGLDLLVAYLENPQGSHLPVMESQDLGEMLLTCRVVVGIDPITGGNLLDRRQALGRGDQGPGREAVEGGGTGRLHAMLGVTRRALLGGVLSPLGSLLDFFLDRSLALLETLLYLFFGDLFALLDALLQLLLKDMLAPLDGLLSFLFEDSFTSFEPLLDADLDTFAKRPPPHHRDHRRRGRDQALSDRQLLAGDQVDAGDRFLRVLDVPHHWNEADQRADLALHPLPALGPCFLEVLPAVLLVGRRLPQAAQASRVRRHAGLPADEGIEVG